MKRKFVGAILVLFLCSCASPKKSAEPWLECAKRNAIGVMETGIPKNWPTTGSLPEGIAVQVVSLGAHPPEAIHDAYFRTLHLAPSSNAFYLEQSGGIAGVRQLYGPISLTGLCTAPTPGAP